MTLNRGRAYLRGWILTGGASSRMGQDKALLLLGGHTLLDLAVDKARSVCRNVTVLCGTGDRLAVEGADAIKDLRAACGPLGGIEAALHHSDAEWNLFLAVDTPLIPSSLLCAWGRELLESQDCATPKTGAAVFSDRGRIHALPLILRREVLPWITASLDAGEYRLLQQVTYGAEAAGFELSITDVDTLGAALESTEPVERSAWFQNANTPDDFETMRKIASRQA